MRDPDSFREAAPEYVLAAKGLTYDDYCKLPSDHRYELIEGGLRLVPSPSVIHQGISHRIVRAFDKWIDDHNQGRVYYSPLDVVLDERNVVQPDILYVAQERLGIITEQFVAGAPDLVVEILSPSTGGWDRTKKRELYGRFGVRELWLVDPEARSIELAVLRGTELVTAQVCGPGAELASVALLGFTLDVDVILGR